MNAETVTVRLPGGLSARVSVTVIEEPLPTPNERAHERKPTAGEFDTVARELVTRRYTFAADPPEKIRLPDPRLTPIEP